MAGSNTCVCYPEMSKDLQSRNGGATRPPGWPNWPAQPCFLLLQACSLPFPEILIQTLKALLHYLMTVDALLLDTEAKKLCRVRA